MGKKSQKLIDENKNYTLNKIGLIINSILAIVAIIVLYFTFKQTKASIDSSNAAIKSVELADSVLKITKLYNESTLKLQKENEANSSMENRKRFTLDSLSMSAQIISLKETQKRFELENETYVEANNFYFQLNDENGIPKMRWALSNLGKYPVRIVASRCLLYYQYKTISSTIPQFPFTDELKPLNLFINNLSPSLQSSDFRRLNATELFHLKSKTLIICFAGEVHYKNLITKKIRVNKFLITTESINTSSYRYEYNITQ